MSDFCRSFVALKCNPGAISMRFCSDLTHTFAAGANALLFKAAIFLRSLARCSKLKRKYQ